MFLKPLSLQLFHLTDHQPAFPESSLADCEPLENTLLVILLTLHQGNGWSVTEVSQGQDKLISAGVLSLCHSAVPTTIRSDSGLGKAQP